MLRNMISKYKHLKKRERIAVIVLLAVFSVSVYYNMICKPLLRNSRTYMIQTERLRKQLTEIKMRNPKVETGMKRIEQEKEEGEKLLAKIEALENKLPSKRATSNLIAELTRLAKDIKIDSIRQKIDKGEEYSRIFVEIRFDSPYNEMVDYIQKIETISPFLKIEELEIIEPRKRKKESDTIMRLVVSSLLGDVPFSSQLKAKEIGKTSSDLRDIFVSKVLPESATVKIDMKLEGITYGSEISTAIIDGDVVKEGSIIKNYTVNKIMYDKVILTDGVEEFILKIER